MAPKRKEKEAETSNGKLVKADPVKKTEFEMFLQAFEKPTQIYRFLRTINILSPIFLHRNLTYMKGRMSRSHKHRKDFRIDDMLAKKEAARKPTLNAKFQHLVIYFDGLQDKTLASETEQGAKTAFARVETALVKYAHKKRKDCLSAANQVVSNVDVAVNVDDRQTVKVQAISIAAEQFESADATNQQSSTITFRVEVYHVLSNTSDDSSAVKRFKPNAKLYQTELLAFDKAGRCLLTEGEYILALNEVLGDAIRYSSPKKQNTWESIHADFGFDFIDTDLLLESGADAFDDTYFKAPTLKFHLAWSKDLVSGLVERPPLLFDNKENLPALTNGVNNNNGPAESKESTAAAAKPEDRVNIVYQFMYNNNSCQQTQACDNFECPWCSVNCKNLYALLKHLKLCHARFTFTYVPTSSTSARIDVAINEMYDGSYTGSPHDLLSDIGFSRVNGPVRRSTVTNILVCRPRRTKPSLSEFLELDDNEFDGGPRPYITGHNRLYHHTMTCLPVLPKELDIDSEDEADPEWLKEKTNKMIDEFTDVNEGEKELMKMWNLHVMKYGYVGDCQIPLACEMFLESYGRELLAKNLYRNFILHLSSLFDYGLLSPETFYTIMQKLQKILNDCAEGRRIIFASRDAQNNYWVTTGLAKHHEREAQKKASEAKEAERKKSEPKAIGQQTPTKSPAVGTPSAASTSNKASKPNLSSSSLSASDSSSPPFRTSTPTATPNKFGKTPPALIPLSIKTRLSGELKRRPRHGVREGSLKRRRSFQTLPVTNGGEKSRSELAQRRRSSLTSGSTTLGGLPQGIAIDKCNPKVVLTRNKSTQLLPNRTRSSTGNITSK